MKDYDRQIIWLDYFNSSISRSQGRRVPVSKAVKSPSLGELAEATKRLGYDSEPVQASYPKRFWLTSGYVSINRMKSKAAAIREIADTLRTVRGEQRRG